MRFALRMAWRETRGAWRHFLGFSACVALGVAALVSVGTLAANLDRTLTREARALMGGDLELRSSRPLGADAEAALQALRDEGAAVVRVRELVGMANTIGGKILLGVRDDGAVVGLKDSNTLRARVQDMARNCDPPVKVVVEPVGDLVVVHVHESDGKPVQCSEGFFWRQGAVTQKLSRDEIRDFFRAEGTVRFDLAPCPRFRYPRDFDRAKYDAWLKLSGITGRPRAEDVLVNIEAAERTGGKLLFRNAGVLFFAKNVRHFFNQAYITCLLAKGADKVHILDRKDFDGGVVADIEDALRFIERNTRTAYRIERLQRENRREMAASDFLRGTRVETGDCLG